MKILALELSSARGSLALLDGEVKFERDWPNDRQNSGVFFENLKTVSEEFGSPALVIVGLGPGSYAGTRIAISAAIGLSFGGTVASAARTSVSSQDLGRDRARPSIELIGYPSICAIDSDETEYCVVGDARRQSFFYAHVRANQMVKGPLLFSEFELRDRLNGVDKSMSIFASEELRQFERVQVRFPSARVLAQLARDENPGFVCPPLEPMYLREPHITVPKPIA